MREIKRDRRKKFMWAGTSIMVLVLVLMLLHDFSTRTNGRVEQESRVHLKEITQQITETFNTKMENCVRNVNFVADFFSSQELFPKEQMENFLQESVKSSEIERLAVITKTGELYVSTDIDSQVSNYRYAEAALGGESGISDIFYSSATGEKVFSIYAPIYQGTEVVAAAMGTVVVEHLTDYVSFSGFGGEGYVYVLQGNGDMVLWTEHKNMLISGVNFLTFLGHSVSESTLSASALKAKMQLRETGTFHYTYREEERVAYYEPTNVKDWYILSVVPKSATEQYGLAVNRYALQLVLKMLLFSVAGMLLLFFIQKNQQKKMERAHMEVVSSNKKFQIVMRHTPYLMFEYEFCTDRMYNMSELLQKKLQKNELKGVKEWLRNTDFFTPHSIKEALAVTRWMERDEKYQQVDLEKSDGSWLRVSLSPIHQYDGLHAIGTVEDITNYMERKAQYERERTYCKGMLRQSVAGMEVDLEEKMVKEHFHRQQQSVRNDGSKDYTKDLIHRFTSVVHPEYQTKIEQIFQIEQLLEILQRGVREIKEEFPLYDSNQKNYTWAAMTIHFLSNPENGHPIIYAYLLNVDEERRHALQLEYQSERDGLTEIYNRVAFVKRVEQILRWAADTDKHALLMMDIDGFKIINDTYGHQEGDRLLKSVAEILQRSVDETAYVARLGGDEFVIFLKSVKDKEEVERTAEYICREIEQFAVKSTYECKITLSIGCAMYQPGDTFETMYPRADERLYRAKRDGKNRAYVE